VSSVVLMGMAATLRTDICAMNPSIVCQRTDFAIGIGAIVGILSLVAILLVACSKMGAVSYLLISFVSSGLFIFGVVFLTARDGPATSLGTMYFSTWTGAAVSVFYCKSDQIFILDQTSLDYSSIPHPDTRSSFRRDTLKWNGLDHGLRTCCYP